MNRFSLCRPSLGKLLLIVGMSAAGIASTGQAVAGCGYPSPSMKQSPDGGPRAADGLMSAVYRPGSERFLAVFDNEGSRAAAIVGMWTITLISDGTAYPAPIPYGAVVDFGTQQWHSDGTEILISGGRAPSTGDVCMGVWEQSGVRTYKLKHIALAYVSSDTPPPLGGPVVPAAFLGPAIIKEVVTVNAVRDGFEGTFTLDQYAKDETTLLQHIAGKVVGKRVTVD